MMFNVYTLIYVVAWFVSFFFVVSNQKKNDTISLYFAFTCILIILAGFNTASPDYLGYKTIAQNVGSYEDFYSGSTKNLHGDFTFFLISSIVNTFKLDIQFVFIIVAFISVGITSFVIYKTSCLPMLSLLLFSSHNYLNKDVIQIRAALSSALILLAIYFFSRGRKLFGGCSYFFSLLSHSSAIVTAPPIIMSRLCPPQHVKSVLFFLLIFAFFINVFAGGFFGILNYFESFLPSSVKNYLYWDIYNYDMGVLNLSSIRALFFSLVLLWLYNKHPKSKEDVILTFSYIFGTCILIAFSDFAILSGRLSSILMSGEVIVLVNAAYKMKGKSSLVFILFYSGLLLVNNVFFSSYNLGFFDFKLS
ncbi:TPA: EpsG family protein [Escherichia coli]|uniref:EpsG family protein n=3 Tax=Escherichia coli TaxID=562 RepID=UPI0006A0458E|nr:EpsG family protein [Escherichia coli]EFE2089279.1 EpsG family protein [Escherichia coli]EFF0580995.1 EpsG family protein [Escherichia coli]EFH2874137.1 hypothetical protein [Escherichia coli]EFH7368415.1 hypothetical protein [Escherichia coli]EFJ3580480.1 EpsG family protein [Escherichia coli]